MYLIDTNVFLEALLEQEKTLIVKSFLQSVEVERMFMTDLTLHSIGIILFKLGKSELFLSFLENGKKVAITLNESSHLPAINKIYSFFL